MVGKAENHLELSSSRTLRWIARFNEKYLIPVFGSLDTSVAAVDEDEHELSNVYAMPGTDEGVNGRTGLGDPDKEEGTHMRASHNRPLLIHGNSIAADGDGWSTPRVLFTSSTE